MSASDKFREVYVRKLREFTKIYRKSRIGMIGLAILLLFLGLAAFAPLLTPYDPIRDNFLADETAFPVWASYFPGLTDLPPTLLLDLKSESFSFSSSNPNYLQYSTLSNGTIQIDFRAPEDLTAFEPVVGEIRSSFTYDYKSPRSWALDFKWKVPSSTLPFAVTEVLLTSPNGTTFNLWDSQLLATPTNWEQVIIDSRDFALKQRLGVDPAKTLSEILIPEKGEYQVAFRLTIQPFPGGEYTMQLRDVEVSVPGLVHGLLGTDHLGTDLFSQLAYGTRVSLLVGIIASLIAVGLGLVVGLLAGFVGGAVDETLMRFVDVLLAIPGLPLLIVIAAIYGASLTNLILILGFLSWMGTSRLVRSLTFSLKEMAFVEAARAAGARAGYIMRRHLAPNVTSVIFATFILLIPGAILAEAALSFLGLTDPRIASWGRMLNNAYAFGAFSRLVWWWVLPPGFAITLLSLAFVFIGHATDEILNPRLRKR